ncbi:hypothetical protein AAC387_Pa03g2909 [Persea americana]
MMDLNPLAHVQIDQPPTFFTVAVAPREPHAAICTDAQLIIFYIPDSTASAPPQLYVCPGADYFPGAISSSPFSSVDTLLSPKRRRRYKRRKKKVFLLSTFLRDPFCVYFWKDLIYVNP